MVLELSLEAISAEIGRKFESLRIKRRDFILPPKFQVSRFAADEVDGD